MKVAFVIPGDINTPTGGYRYDREIVSRWQSMDVEVEVISLKGNYPFPREEEILLASKILQEKQNFDVYIFDGLAGGVLPNVMEELSGVKPVIALIHHPLFLESGLDEANQKMLRAKEAVGLKHVRAVITSSQTTKETVADVFQFPTGQIHAVDPGVERAPFSVGSGSPTVNILSIGTISERKGHDVLLKALSGLTDLNWRLDLVGSAEFNPKLLNDLKVLTGEGRIENQVVFHGALEPEQVEELYHHADLFALASRYEGYGMVYSEAIVRGLPVLGTTAGAIPQTVPKDCGLLVEPDDVEAAQAALRQLIVSADLRAKLSAAAKNAEPDFPTWERSAEMFLNYVRQYA